MTNYFSEINQNIFLPNMPAGTLKSTQSITIYDLLGSGEINGFPSAIAAGASFGTESYLKAALKDVFLNGTQILKQSANLAAPKGDDFNFTPIILEFRTGTSNQQPLTNNFLISQAQVETFVGTEVKFDNPVTRSITTSCDQLRVTMSFPSLQTFNDDGTVTGAAVRILMKITENDGTQHPLIINDEISGKGSNYKRDYGISVTGMDFPIALEVTRFNEDSNTPKIQSASFFSSFTEIQAEQNAYLNSAYTALRISAESFGGAVPKRMFRIQGTKISIPHNSTVQSDGSLSYTGTFNGTFKAAKEWTNDPAWILYDVLTSSKGLGDHLDSTKIDVFSFYSASVYCAEQVDDMTGTGTTEPRFAFNSVIRGQTSPYNLINKICQTMRAMAFYSAGSIEIVQDRPSDPVYLFNLSNVTEAGFSYTNTSQTTKFTQVNVSYFNMDTQEPDFVPVKADQSLINKYGLVVKNIRAYACTSFGQARRFGKWFIYTQNNECELCNFTTSIVGGVVVRPGMVISIADPMRTGTRRGGRISAVNSTTEIVVDDSENTDLATTNGATLSIVMPDGTMEAKTISSISGTTITVSSAFSTSPNPNSVWLIENSTLTAQTYRVISVSEAKQTQYSISAVVHDPSKYSNVEDGTNVTKKTTTTLNQILPAPANLNATESIVEINGKAVSKIDFTFSTVDNAFSYFIQHRLSTDNFQNVETQSTSLELSNTVNGTYEFRVFTKNPLGQLSSQPAELNFEAVGKTAPPEQVTGLTAEVIDSQNVKLSFNKSTALDVIHGGNVVIKHSADTTGNASFANSTTLVDNIPGNATEAIVPNISGEFFVKFKDDLGILSTDETSIIVTKPEAQPKLGIQTRREDSDSPPFQGSKDDTFYDSSLDRLLLSGATEFDTVTDVDALSSFDFSGPISSKGIYDFTSILDLGSKFVLDLEKHFKVFGILPNDLFDTRTANIDTWTDFDGAKAEDCDAQLFVSTSDADPSATTAATYAQSGSVITVTKSTHGLSVGDRLNLTFSTGTASSGSFEILTVPNVNTFTVAAKQEEATYVAVGPPLTIQISTVKPHPSVGASLDITILSGSVPSGTFTVNLANFVNIFQVEANPANTTFNTQPPKKPISGTLSYIDSSASTSGNCTFSNVFSKFNKFNNGKFIGRAFQFRAILTSNDPAQNIGVDELGYTASFEPRTENSIENSGATNGVFASGTNTKTVTLQHPFFAGTSALGGSTSKYLPSIGITLQNAQSGDFFTVHTITGTSFQIDVKNGSSFVNRNFTYIASGFGKGS